MRLATVAAEGRDGALVVVSRDGARCVRASSVAPTLQAALDDWETTAPRLEALARALESGGGEPLDVARCLAPLPRAYEWIDGSAYLHHIRLVRRARGAEPPATLEHDPLVYQGGSGVLLGPRAPLRQLDPAYGLDYEAELCVILGDTPLGTRAEDAAPYVRLLGLVNDITYRGLVPSELAKGFGFFQSKPATAFAPFVVTPDELDFRGGRAALRVRSHRGGAIMGDPEAGPEMHFSFYDLIAHVTRTRALTAGTIIGSGTVSNVDPERGVSCLAEQRVRETLRDGAPRTPFLEVGEHLRIEAFDSEGFSVFGALEHEVVA